MSCAKVFKEVKHQKPTNNVTLCTFDFGFIPEFKKFYEHWDVVLPGIDTEIINLMLFTEIL
jgi:hypothetical protein